MCLVRLRRPAVVVVRALTSALAAATFCLSCWRNAAVARLLIVGVLLIAAAIEHLL